MSEKQKNTDPVALSAEEARAMTEIPVELILDSYGSGKFAIKFANMVEKAKYVCMQYSLNLDDLAVMKKELVIKKTGKYKYANANGLNCTKVNVVQSDLQNGMFMVKAQVFFDGIDTPFEDLGMCDRREGGREYQTNATILETASTRAILRAIGIHLPMSIQDQPTEEQIEKDIEQKVNAEAERVYEKKQAAIEKSAEIKQTQAVEVKLQAPEREYNRRVKDSKKADKTNALIGNILNHSDDPVTPDPDADRMPPEDI